jgi:hypothetical protein
MGAYDFMILIPPTLCLVYMIYLACFKPDTEDIKEE